MKRECSAPCTTAPWQEETLATTPASHQAVKAEKAPPTPRYTFLLSPGSGALWAGGEAFPEPTQTSAQSQTVGAAHAYLLAELVGITAGQALGGQHAELLC